MSQNHIDLFINIKIFYNKMVVPNTKNKILFLAPTVQAGWEK